MTGKGFTTINYIDDFQLSISGPIKEFTELINKTSD